MEINIVVNDVAREGLAAVHGLSLYIVDDDRYILFGTGPSPGILKRNAEAMGIDLEMLDAVIVSHEHIAHSGGVLALPPYTTIYVPRDYPSTLIHKYIEHGYRVIPVNEVTLLDTGVSIIGPYYGPPNEIVLVVEKEHGLVVFMGCGHAGADKILDDIRRIYGAEISYLVGGLHLAGAPEHIVTRVVDKIAAVTRRIIPLHCSGGAQDYLAKRYPERLVVAIGGDRITI